MRNMATPTARSLQTYFAQLRNEDKPSASAVLSFTSVQQTKDQYKFYVPSYTIARDAKPDELKKAFEWYQFVQQLEKANRLHIDKDTPEGEGGSLDDDSVPF